MFGAGSTEPALDILFSVLYDKYVKELQALVKSAWLSKKLGIKTNDRLP